VVWAFVVLLIVIAFLQRWPLLAAAWKRIGLLAASTAFIAVNWFIYIWSVTTNHMVEASLGYFINPLVNVLFGFWFFHERLLPREKVSIVLAAAAVLWLTFGAGTFPWISIALAISFALYGLMRKFAHVTAIEGLAIETALLLPLAIGYLLYRREAGILAFGTSRTLDLWLLLAGPLTALPLLCFAAAVRRLRLATIGVLQYISPSLQFMLAVMVYSEPFDRHRAIAFVLIWISLAIYSTASFKAP
jgi:chloramphenicol-sensitive protein RarD